MDDHHVRAEVFCKGFSSFWCFCGIYIIKIITMFFFLIYFRYQQQNPTKQHADHNTSDFSNYSCFQKYTIKLIASSTPSTFQALDSLVRPIHL